jgi:hypothetical protein
MVGRRFQRRVGSTCPNWEIPCCHSHPSWPRPIPSRSALSFLQIRPIRHLLGENNAQRRHRQPNVAGNRALEPSIPRFQHPQTHPLQPLRCYKCRCKSCHRNTNTVGTASGNNSRRPCRPRSGSSSSTRNPCFRCTSHWSELRDFCASGSSAAHRCNGRGG